MHLRVSEVVWFARGPVQVCASVYGSPWCMRVRWVRHALSVRGRAGPRGQRGLPDQAPGSGTRSSRERHRWRALIFRSRRVRERAAAPARTRGVGEGSRGKEACPL